ncbi:hypothetical protein FH972_025434 [Carpinus fangiana]|uniref:glutaminase n=1 Tax=Carpinus fangiana TaxID=176857 RepID=A0A5N6L149_9ROSI|nr:hypothetical protein FH972_025434 [Carpinus fangiana]
MAQINVGVLALQGAFSEHIMLLRHAFAMLQAERDDSSWIATEVRTPEQLNACDALIIPGGESTAIALVASRCEMLEPLRSFVKIERRPTWGTCAGLILLAEAANRTKKGGQDLIGGIDVRVNRNYYGRQVESFEADIDLPFLKTGQPGSETRPFRGVFIRAPVVEKILPQVSGIQTAEQEHPETIVAPSKAPRDSFSASKLSAPVEVMATLPGRTNVNDLPQRVKEESDGDIIAVRQANVFGTSFHPELTVDPRIHIWWLREVKDAVAENRSHRI